MKTGLALPVTIIFLSLSSVSFSAESAVVRQFREGLEKKDPSGVSAVIKNNLEKIPSEVKYIIDDAFLPGTSLAEKESKIDLAERLARAYMDASGDDKPLIECQKRAFESHLSEPVSPEPLDGVHTVNIGHPEGGKNSFTPNNIVIKSGETVRWVDYNRYAHVLSTVSAISAESITSPAIKPGKSWARRFYKPGVYYYICCQYNGKMYGKITVE